MTKLSQQDKKDLLETYPNINRDLLLQPDEQREWLNKVVCDEVLKTYVQEPVVDLQPIKRSKYNAVPTVYNGIRYASKKEAAFAQKLDLRLKAGELHYVLRQVPFDLGAGIIYRADFVTLKMDGHPDGICWLVTVYEVKGMETPAWKLKHKLFKNKYPLIALEVV